MASETLTSSEHRELSKIVIKAESFNELLEMIGEYFHYNRGVNFVGGPFKSKIKGKWFYCQKITILVK